MSDTITILYIDDEQVNITLFKANFRSIYTVLSATSGEEALRILETNKDISIVISDMRMPNMTGVEFVRKANIKFPDLNYYILSGFNITDEIKLIMEEKILTGYFNKPIDVVQIKEVINGVMQ